MRLWRLGSHTQHNGDQGQRNSNGGAAEERIEISAEIKREEKVEGKGFYRREKGYDRYYRAYALPARVKPDEAKATYRNGVLEIVLPKTEIKEKGRSIKID